MTLREFLRKLEEIKDLYFKEYMDDAKVKTYKWTDKENLNAYIEFRTFGGMTWSVPFQVGFNDDKTIEIELPDDCGTLTVNDANIYLYLWSEALMRIQSKSEAI